MLYWNEGYLLGQRSIRITVSLGSTDINTRDTRVHSPAHGRTIDRHRTLDAPRLHGPLQLFTPACQPAFWTFNNFGTAESLIEDPHNSVGNASYAAAASMTRAISKGSASVPCRAKGRGGGGGDGNNRDPGRISSEATRADSSRDF